MLAAGCGDGATSAGEPAGPLPYASSVQEFEPGRAAGFGEDAMPDVVLGAPDGRGPNAGTTDVVSLGVGGHIVLAFEPLQVVDGPGVDFIVFENAFWEAGDPTRAYAELGEVSVSDDGTSWHTFPCDVGGTGDGRWPGCAGWQPTLPYDPFALVPLQPELTGGDPFDLADLGLSSARYIRIDDLSTGGEAPGAGFDLDAVGVIHARQP